MVCDVQQYETTANTEQPMINVSTEHEIRDLMCW